MSVETGMSFVSRRQFLKTGFAAAGGFASSRLVAFAAGGVEACGETAHAEIWRLRLVD